MSEIFDFLKKTEAERRKKTVVPEAMFRTPAPETAEIPEPEVSPDPLMEEPAGMEIFGTDHLDLAQATSEIKHVLDPHTLVGEQFRLLRSRLGLMQKQRGIKTVLITSTVPEEGKTFTASGLAGVIAQEPGKRVLLIDADMRKPRSGAVFGLNGSETPGLSDVLQGKLAFQKALVRLGSPEFCLLPSGPVPSNPSELLSSEAFEHTLKAAAENFDWVIVDSPPALSISDTTLLSPLCDTVVLVIRANSTPSKLALDAINRIGRDRICGVVINRQRQIPNSQYYYQYYYKK